MRQNRKYGKSANGETFQAVRNQREHARPHDRTGGLSYLKMPLSTFYYKVKKDDIPVIKQGKHLYIYRDELDRWLESSRKNPAPQSFEEENESMLASHRRKPNPKNW